MSQSDYKVFISHAGIDTWIAKQIQSHVSQCGPSTFLDEGDIYVGDDFENILLREIRQSEELVVLFTPWAKDRPYVWLEIGAAWVLGKRIIFVLHGLTAEDVASDKNNPTLLKKTNIIVINDIDRYFSQLKERFSKRKVE